MLARMLLAAFTLLATSCDSMVAPTLRDREPVIVGPIVARDVPTSVSGDRHTVHVRDDEDEECGIVFTIGSDTEIVRAAGEGADVDDLRPGRTVAVWASGAILLSCPAQAGAEAIEILSS